MPLIRIIKGGPYRVSADVPLIELSQEMSEYGEPLSWQHTRDFDTGGKHYLLCRCGKSKTFPFCDNTHLEIGFEGLEMGPTDRELEPDLTLEANDGLTVRKYQPLCMLAGFCILENTSIDELIEFSDKPKDHQRGIKMVEDCPAGSLVYSLSLDGPNVEPELGQRIALTREGCMGELMNGPFWVTGSIPIQRADGVPFLPRNRVTLCSCGQSKLMPLCDGTHRHIREAAGKDKQV